MTRRDGNAPHETLAFCHTAAILREDKSAHKAAFCADKDVVTFATAPRLAAALALLPAFAAPQQPKSALLSTSVVLTITSPTAMFYGQTVDGSAQVNSSDGSTSLGGTITFYDGTVSLCVLPATTAASCPASAGEGYAAGTHILTAVYSGDATHEASTSNAATVTVLKDTTTALLTSSINPATAGQSITFTATIQGAHATPAGSVTFYDGASALATAPLDATGTTTITTSAFAAGTHSLTAVYGATANFAAAASSALCEQVEPAIAAPTGSSSFVIGVGSVTVRAGQTAIVPVKVSPANGFSQPVNLACANLPEEATCAFAAANIPAGGGSTMLTLSTAAPRDCGTTPYGVASLPFATPLAAGLFVFLIPSKRQSLRRLLIAVIALSGIAGMTGCGTGNCTDLGTRPGTYTITVTGTSTGAQPATVSQKIVMKVTIEPLQNEEAARGCLFARFGCSQA